MGFRIENHLLDGAIHCPSPNWSERESGDIVDLLANQTGISTTDGGLSVAETIAANVPIDEDDSGREPRELRIRFKDSDGTEKVLIIKYN